MKIWWTIRSYYRQLHRVPLPLHVTAPGPFSLRDPGSTFTCIGPCFPSRGAGPFTSYSDMARWFDTRRFDYLSKWCCAVETLTVEKVAKAPVIPDFPTSPPLVLCHMDFHHDNFLLDEDGKVWMIDWGFAGAYPAWMEHAHMLIRSPVYRKPSFWDRLKARFLVGNYERYFWKYVLVMGWVSRWWQAFDCSYPKDFLEKWGVEIVDGRLQYIALTSV